MLLNGLICRKCFFVKNLIFSYEIDLYRMMKTWNWFKIKKNKYFSQQYKSSKIVVKKLKNNIINKHLYNSVHI